MHLLGQPKMKNSMKMSNYSFLVEENYGGRYPEKQLLD